MQEYSEAHVLAEAHSSPLLSKKKRASVYQGSSTAASSSHSLSISNFSSRVSFRVTSPDSSSRSINAIPSSRSRRESKIPPLQSLQASQQPPDPTQRPFDAIVNFLPHDLPEKAMLKHAILVTTISRPFLVAAVPASIAASLSSPTLLGSPIPGANPTGGSGQSTPKGTERRKSVLKRPQMFSMYSMPPTPPLSSGDSLNSLQQPQNSIPAYVNNKAHLVHLLPSSKGSKANGGQKIAQSIESFLLSFSYPAGSGGGTGAGNAPGFAIGSGSGIGMGQGGMGSGTGGDGMEHAKAYLTDTSAFREVVNTQVANAGLSPGAVVAGDGNLRWTVANLVLSGCLDVDEEWTREREQRKAAAEGNGAVGGFLAKQEVRMMKKQRAWVGGAAEIIISPTPSNIATATGMGLGLSTPSPSLRPSTAGSTSAGSFSSLPPAASASSSAPSSSPSLPLSTSSKSTRPTRVRQHSYSDPDPRRSPPSSNETIRPPSSTLAIPAKDPVPPRRHSSTPTSPLASSSRSPVSPGSSSPTRAGFAGIGAGGQRYGSMPTSTSAQAMAVSLSSPAPAVRPLMHSKSHSRSGSASGAGIAMDPAMMPAASYSPPSKASRYPNELTEYLHGGHTSSGNIGIPMSTPSSSSGTSSSERPLPDIPSEPPYPQRLRRVSDAKRIQAHEVQPEPLPTPPDSDENERLGTQKKILITVTSSSGDTVVDEEVGKEVIQIVEGDAVRKVENGEKRRVLHKGRGRGHGVDSEKVVVDGVDRLGVPGAGEHVLKTKKSANSMRWKFWKSSAVKS